MEINNFCTIYIARHGETEWNVKGLIQGSKDSNLTPHGQKQARALKDKLKLIEFDAVFSSDLTRAIKTAEVVALAKNLAVKTTHLLREKNFGEYEGREYKVFQEELKEYNDEFEKLSKDEKNKYKFPSMESDEEVIARSITFLREVAVGYRGKTVLVVTHGSMIGNFLIHLGLLTYKNRHNRKIDNAGYLKLLPDGVDFFVQEADGIEI